MTSKLFPKSKIFWELVYHGRLFCRKGFDAELVHSTLNYYIAGYKQGIARVLTPWRK